MNDFIREALDRKQQRRSRRNRDPFRLQLVKVFELIAKNGTFSRSYGVIDENTGVYVLLILLGPTRFFKIFSLVFKLEIEKNCATPLLNLKVDLDENTSFNKKMFSNISVKIRSLPNECAC